MLAVTHSLLLRLTLEAYDGDVVKVVLPAGVVNRTPSRSRRRPSRPCSPFASDRLERDTGPTASPGGQRIKGAADEIGEHAEAIGGNMLVIAMGVPRVMAVGGAGVGVSVRLGVSLVMVMARVVRVIEVGVVVLVVGVVLVRGLIGRSPADGEHDQHTSEHGKDTSWPPERPDPLAHSSPCHPLKGHR